MATENKGVAGAALAQPVIPKKIVGRVDETLWYDVSTNAKLATPDSSAGYVGVIDFRNSSVLTVRTPTTWTATDLEAYGAFSEGTAISAFVPCMKSDGTVAKVVTLSNGNDFYTFTGEDATAIMGMPFLTLRSATDQGADAFVYVIKSS